MEIDTIGIDLGKTELMQRFRHEKVFNSRSYHHFRLGEPMQREARYLRARPLASDVLSKH